VLLVGLTGGIGSGKSTVAALLRDRGAVVVDADEIVHRLQRAGTPVFDAIVERFGESVVGADGQLDRARLAGIVFDDPDARGDLNAIVHPAVWVEMSAAVEARRQDPDAVVVLDVPLLAEAGGGSGLDMTVTVEAPEAVRVERLARARGMGAAEVRARIATQASDAERRALADVVVENAGDEAALAGAVATLWDERIRPALRGER